MPSPPSSSRVSAPESTFKVARPAFTSRTPWRSCSRGLSSSWLSERTNSRKRPCSVAAVAGLLFRCFGDSLAGSLRKRSTSVERLGAGCACCSEGARAERRLCFGTCIPLRATIATTSCLGERTSPVPCKTFGAVFRLEPYQVLSNARHLLAVSRIAGGLRELCCRPHVVAQEIVEDLESARSLSSRRLHGRWQTRGHRDRRRRVKQGRDT